MSLIKWTPFIEPYEDFFGDFKGLNANAFIPAVDVYQTDDEVVVKTPLAGIDPKDVEITVENDTLILKGETKKESEVDDKNYYRKEIRSGSFYRSIPLPTGVVADKAEATFSEGMLKITIPKAEEVKPKNIKIKINK